MPTQVHNEKVVPSSVRKEELEEGWRTRNQQKNVKLKSQFVDMNNDVAESDTRIVIVDSNKNVQSGSDCINELD